jgi:microcin C transport system substrate-binding protein
MIDLYRVTTDEAKRVELAHKMQTKIHEIGGFVPAFVRDYFRVVYWRWWQFPKVPATKLSEGSFDVFGTSLFWLDPELKEVTLKAMKTGTTFEPETIVDTTFKAE